ncbi:somatostatin receptor type 5-like [Lytechinus variegatus]|uniref:somatostatin receptor type 5-like n=1 Tax=Lytechinus variegatus TaxID=7654 RepID=UPI001BB1BACA|nr:somatostatin receptor type 5-like [Lytechinus variegatus]
METREAVSNSSATPSTPNAAMTTVLGTSVFLYEDLDFTLQYGKEGTLSSLDHPLLQELGNEWDVTTISYEYIDDDADAVSSWSSWSWFPIRWTFVRCGELVVGVIGIIGNLLVVIVLFQRRAESRSTDTLIGALAVADLLTSVGLLPTPYAKTVPVSWFGQLYCTLVWSPLYMWVWAFMSGFLLSAISIERYIAVSHPIYFRRILTRRRVSEVVVFLWICAMMVCIPQPFLITVDKVHRRCAVRILSYELRAAFAFYVTTIQLFIPATIMAVTQTLIAVKLKAQSKRFEGSKTYHEAAGKAVIKMMFMVIVAYIICWTPNRFLYLITRLFRLNSPMKSQISEGLIVLAAVNSSINPIIYSVRYRKFRQAVKELFTRKEVRNSAMFDDPININTNPTNDASV